MERINNLKQSEDNDFMGYSAVDTDGEWF